MYSTFMFVYNGYTYYQSVGNDKTDYYRALDI